MTATQSDPVAYVRPQEASLGSLTSLSGASRPECVLELVANI